MCAPITREFHSKRPCRATTPEARVLSDSAIRCVAGSGAGGAGGGELGGRQHTQALIQVEDDEEDNDDDVADAEVFAFCFEWSFPWWSSILPQSRRGLSCCRLAVESMCYAALCDGCALPCWLACVRLLDSKLVVCFTKLVQDEKALESDLNNERQSLMKLGGGSGGQAAHSDDSRGES
jgi:hypothetical protein